MKLGYFDTQLRNVGDDLNPYIFSRLFPSMQDVHPHSVFIGIGSVFDDRFASYAHKLVFGPGARGENALPALDASWDIRFVRGPLTAAAVKQQGVDCPYITDPGLLVAEFFEPRPQTANAIGLIPYFRSEHQPWQEIAKRLGFMFISPRLSVEAFVERVRQCRLVVTEAMHGAIIADALRVPWLPYSSLTTAHEQQTHHFKWRDWCQSVDLPFNEITLPILWNPHNMGWISRLKQSVKMSLICHRLQHYAKAETPYLSDNSTFKHRVEQLRGQVQQVRQDYGL